MNKQSSGLQAMPLADSEAINLGVYFLVKIYMNKQNYFFFFK